MLKDPECAARYEEAMRAHEAMTVVEPRPLDIPRVPTLAQIRKLQAVVGQLEQIPNEPKHHFADGQYCRELFIQAGAVVVGKMHRHEHMAFLLQGEATVWTDEGMVRMKAPHVWVSHAGAKRALYTHTDCVFATTHVTRETELDKIEDYVIIPEIGLIEGGSP